MAQADSMTNSEAQATQTALLKIVAQARALAIGLQNAAPPQIEGSALGTVQYLKETATQLEEISQAIENFS